MENSVLNTQVKLLRVFAGEEFSRVGGNKLIPLTAQKRVCSRSSEPTGYGSKPDLQRDLFFRVNVVNIHVQKKKGIA